MIKPLFLFCAFFFTAALHALSIESAVQTTLDTNPQMQKRISDYKAIRYDLDKAKAGYKPTVELSGAIGPEHTDKKQPRPEVENDLVRKEASLVVTENLFNGFNTAYDVKEQEARVQTARHYAMQEADALALKASGSYLFVLKNKQLLDLELENVRTHERIYKMTREKMTAGLGRRSDLEQTEARMALAYSNYISQQNNYQDAIVNFERFYGNVVSAASMIMPNLPSLPAATLTELEAAALKHNPTLLIEHSNIKTQEAKHGKEKSGFYPKLDAELSADYQNNIDGYENDDRAYRAMLRLYYNLYNGGSDEATRLQNLETITGQRFNLSEQERAVLEKLKLAWMSYQYYYHRIRCLELHANLSKKTAASYAEEYHLGRRSLLDLLNVELEYNDARKEVIKARNELLYAHYRILEATGLLTYTLESNTYSKLDLEAPEGVTFVQADHSLMKEYGETDDYLDVAEICTQAFEPITHLIYDPVAEPETAAGTEPPKPAADDKVVDVIVLDSINFAFASAEITQEGHQKLLPVLEQLKENPLLYVEVHGHTDNIDLNGINQPLSEARAEAGKKALIELGVPADIITTYGHSDREPVADNGTPAGRQKNRRIEFLLKQAKATDE